jgi:hypothetical protein
VVEPRPCLLIHVMRIVLALMDEARVAATRLASVVVPEPELVAAVMVKNEWISCV